MKAAALLDAAHEAGVRFHLDGQSQLRLAYRRDTDPALLVQLRAHKPDIVEHLRASWMPRGVGICSRCGRVAWLPAGPVAAPCDECETDRLLAAGLRAVDPALADDAEVGLHGRPLP